MKSLLWKLLRKNVSATQLAGFAIANFVGLAIVATAIQFYADVSPVFADSDNFLNRDYVIITKRVGTLSSITGSRPASTARSITLALSAIKMPFSGSRTQRSSRSVNLV